MTSRMSWRLLNLSIIALAFVVRASCLVAWEEPGGVHHVDEPLLAYESLALWESVTPRELGWPASTTRLALGGACAVTMVAGPDSPLRGSSTSPPDLLAAVARWSRARLDDPAPLFLTGRWVSILLGTLQVLAIGWAARRWASPQAAAIAALACALSPLAVSHSQYILADITAVLFASLLIGVLSPRTAAGASLARPLAAGALVGLATASKHHFAIWFVAVLADTVVHRRHRLLKEAAVAVAGLLVAYLLMVPWVLTDPLLILKEFLGTVLSKVQAPGRGGFAGPARSLRIATEWLGWLGLVGIAPGLVVAWRSYGRACLPLVAVLVVGFAAVARTSEVHGRYGLLPFAAVALFAGMGWNALATAPRPAVRALALLALLGATAHDAAQLWQTQRHIGVLNSYGHARRWMLENLEPGAGIAVDTHFPCHLPHTRQQLVEMIEEREGPDAYEKKMRSNGFHGEYPEQPMRSTILNDEAYAAFWLRRELSGRQPGEGFRVVLYHDDPRFNSVPTSEALARFLDPSTPPDQRLDALLLNRTLDLGVPPARIFHVGDGPRLYLYLRGGQDAPDAQESSR